MNKKIPLVLASGSQIRADLLKNAGLNISVLPARIDEAAIKESMLADGAPVRDISDALAELKARRVSAKMPGARVLGCDQVLETRDGRLFDKPNDLDDLRRQLTELSGMTHKLHAAAVVVEDGTPVWRHVGSVSLTMRALSADFILAYSERNWPSLGESVGGYKLEEEGARLFVDIRGSYFDILGLPLLPLLNWLVLRGDLES